MTDLDRCLDAMTRAEDEARETVEWTRRDDKSDWWLHRWARDRVRLVARDRATLERHEPNLSGKRRLLPEADQTCLGCTHGGATRYLPDCPERRAVIAYWTTGGGA